MNSSQNPSGKIFYVTYVMKSMRCIFLMELLENFLSVVSILTVKKRIFVVEEADDRPILGKTVERWEPIFQGTRLLLVFTLHNIKPFRDSKKANIDLTFPCYRYAKQATRCYTFSFLFPSKLCRIWFLILQMRYWGSFAN